MNTRKTTTPHIVAIIMLYCFTLGFADRSFAEVNNVPGLLLLLLQDKSSDTCPHDGNGSLQVTPFATLADGNPIPAGKITGYDLFTVNLSSGKATFLCSQSGENNNVFNGLTSGRYAARVTWGGGRSALSLPIDIGEDDWRNTLAPPDENNTFDATQVAELNSCLASAGNNKVCYMSDREGDFNMTRNGSFIKITASGTGPNDRITLMPVPGETVKVVGNWDGSDPKTTHSYDDQRIVSINGDWARVYGLDLSYSNRYGLELNASYAHIEENVVHHCWHAGILINDPGPSGNTSHNVIQYNDVHHIANSTGIWLSYHKEDSHVLDDNLIKGNIIWRNGFLADDTKSNTSPGNSDGIGFFKGCHESYSSGGWLDAGDTGRYNQCRNNKLVRNVVIRNADDCVDISSGEGTLVLGNITANCGDEGNRGFKVYPNIYEKMIWINNLALNSNPYPPGGSTGNSSWGYEINANSPELDDSRPYGSHDFIGNMGLHNDSGNSQVNMRLESYDFGTVEERGDLYNNVSGLGGSDGIQGPSSGFNQGTNHWSVIRDDGTPEVEDTDYKLVSLTFAGDTVRKRWYNKYNEVIGRVMAKKAGNLYNNGTYLPEFYQEKAADDAVAPSNSDSNNQSFWFGGDKVNGVPDKGIGYRYMHAPWLQ